MRKNEMGICPKCGAPITAGATKCEYCGASIAPANNNVNYDQAPAQQPQVIIVNNGPDTSSWPVKSKIVAGVLALLLGGIGVHEFYLGRTNKGILMLLLCWTYVPGIIALIQGIKILTSSDNDFQNKYHCRVSQ